MVYLSAASTISHQPSFQNPGFSSGIAPLTPAAELIAPDYRQYIDAALLRRMSRILRMSVSCAKDCMGQAGITQPGAIVVGTGLGCLQDTEKFLNNVLTIRGLLPPTSFIQSTHNTIAGQISLSIGNHQYNMTHTQNSISFENALLDAMLLAAEGTSDILVGAADEHIGLMSDIRMHLGFWEEAVLTSGASFFMIARDKPANPLGEIVDVHSEAGVGQWSAVIDRFLEQNHLNTENIGMVLLVPPAAAALDDMLHYFAKKGIQEARCMNLLDYSGLYPTASAFGLHVAADLLKSGTVQGTILICNHLNKHNLGLMAVRPVEA